MANCLSELDRKQEAIENFKESIRLNPLNDSAFNNYANCLSQMNQKEEAMTQYEQAIQLNP